MAVNLDAPLAWIQAAGDDLVMLNDLQPNIIKAHTRDHLTALFLRFGAADEAADLLVALAGQMKSALVHLQEIQQFKLSHVAGTPYVGVGLSATGYQALGIDPKKQPNDGAFRRGMRKADFQDELDLWEPPFDGVIDAIILVGDAHQAGHDAGLAGVNAALATHPGVNVIGKQTGRGRHNARKEGIEHFGYVDGRSQPLFLVEDIADEKAAEGGSTN